MQCPRIWRCPIAPASLRWLAFCLVLACRGDGASGGPDAAADADAVAADSSADSVAGDGASETAETEVATVDDSEADTSDAPECLSDDDCPASGDPCTRRVCRRGVCETAGLLWRSDLGGPGYDRAHALVATAPLSGDALWLAGTTSSMGAGGQDLWLVGLDAGGGVSRQSVLGGGGQDLALAAVATRDGVVAAGVADNGDGTDVVLARVSLAGEVVGQWTIARPGDDVARAIAAAAGWDGVLAVAGWSAGDAGRLWQMSAEDGAVLRETALEGRAYAVCALGEGVAVGGLRAAATRDGGGGSDAWVAAVGADGEIGWRRPLGGAGEQAVVAMVSLAGGAAVLVRDEAAARVVRLDGDGEIVWDVEIPEVAPVGLALVGSAGLAVAVTTASGAEVVRIDGGGNTVWRTPIGMGESAEGREGVRALAVTALSDPERVVAAVGVPRAGGGEDTRVQVIDAWGGVVCDPASACLALTPEGCGPVCARVSCDAEAGCVREPVDARCDDGNACTDDGCDGELGCVYADNVAPCEDGEICTEGDRCAGGRCEPGAARSCDDGDACTDDLCVSGGGCEHAPRVCDDGDLCTSDSCDPASGCGAVAIACDDGDLCTTDACDPASGCVASPLACDDGDACTVDSCDPASGCVASPLACDDGDVCTIDGCDAVSGCTATAVTCDDGDACTTDGCDPIVGCMATAITCDDGDACTTDGCDALVGCTATAIACDDGDACTSDGCDARTGCTTTAITCDDGDACTTDGCDALTGCTATAIVCDDGNACTTDGCDARTGCTATAIACDDGDACTTDGCDARTGCTATAITCDDGDACTTDGCDARTGCTATPIACNDGNLCTTDSCDRASGCVATPIACDDGDACTSDTCNPASGCVASAIDCDDGDACTTDGCSAASGCTHAPIDCDDGDACTADTCDGGGCDHAAIDCDDDDPCTSDGCDPDTGCTHDPIDCDDQDACTTDSCDAGGGCVNAPIVCDDGDACTTDDCDSQTGCTTTPVVCAEDEDVCTTAVCQDPAGCGFEPNSAACEDGDPCTEGDVCAGGSCTPGGAADCDDLDPCTDDRCEAGVGCQHDQVVCDDDNACTTDECQAGVGCVYTPIDTGCDDGNACTSGDRCTVDGCLPTAALVFRSVLPEVTGFDADRGVHALSATADGGVVAANGINLTRLDAAGNVQWESPSRSANLSWVAKMLVSTAGGRHWWSNIGGFHGWVRETQGADGTWQVAETQGGSIASRATEAMSGVAGSEDVMLVGRMSSSAFIARRDTSFATVWEKTFKGPHETGAFAATAFGDNRTLVVGRGSTASPLMGVWIVSDDDSVAPIERYHALTGAGAQSKPERVFALSDELAVALVVDSAAQGRFWRVEIDPAGDIAVSPPYQLGTEATLREAAMAPDGSVLFERAGWLALLDAAGNVRWRRAPEVAVPELRAIAPAAPAANGGWFFGGSVRPFGVSTVTRGESLAHRGSWRAIGVPGADGPDGEAGAGAVDVFSSALVATVADATPVAGDAFGRSVAVAQCSKVTVATTSASALHVFELEVWGAGGEVAHHALADPGPVAAWCNPQQALVGMPGQGDAGGAHLYERQGDGSWTLLTTLEPSSAAAGAEAGSAVAADAGIIVLGAPAEAAAGAVYVFEGSGTTWSDVEIVAPDGQAGDAFGAQVALEPGGQHIAVAAPGAGKVYVFAEPDGVTTTVWTHEATLQMEGIGFGAALLFAESAEGLTLSIGAPQDDGGGAEAGAVHTFLRMVDGTWPLLSKTDGAAGERLGATLAGTSTDLAAGAPGDGSDPKVHVQPLFKTGLVQKVDLWARGACTPGSACETETYASCSDDDGCTPDDCDVIDGCVHAPAHADALPCADADVCTSGETCQSGACVGASEIDCDDGDACTADSCDPLAGCANEPVVCDDGNVCTEDTCDPIDGCVGTPVSGACDDGNACSSGDACVAGECQASAARVFRSVFPPHDLGNGAYTSGVFAVATVEDGVIVAHQGGMTRFDEVGRKVWHDGELVPRAVAPSASGRHWLVLADNSIGWITEAKDLDDRWQVTGQATTSLAPNRPRAIVPIAGGDDAIVALDNDGLTQGIVMRLEADFDVPWQKTLQGPSTTRVNAATAYPPHGTAIAGVGSIAVAKYALWIVDDDGNIVRERYADLAGAGRFTHPERLFAHPDGTLVALAIDGVDTQDRFWRIRFDPTGASSVSAPFAFGQDDELPAAMAADGSILVERARALYLFDPQGDLVVRRAYDAPVDGTPAIAAAPDGGFYLAGTTNHFVSNEVVAREIGSGWGTSLATSGWLCAVGRPDAAGALDEVGAGAVDVYAFPEVDPPPRFDDTLYPDTAEVDGGFGRAVGAFYGSAPTVAVASDSDVFLFEDGGLGWAQVARTDEGATGPIALGFDTLVVGAPELGDAGGAHVYYRESDGSWPLLASVEPELAAAGARAGSAVSVYDASSVVLGAPEEPGGGAVFVIFDLSSEFRIVAPDRQPGDGFGAVVAYLDDGVERVVVAAPGAGKVYVFQAPTTSGGDWVHTATLAGFGTSVAIGDLLYVGDPDDDGSGTDAGAVHAFARGTDDQWVLAHVLRGVPGARMGAALATAGSSILIGAPGDGTVPPEVVFRNSEYWHVLQKIDPWARGACTPGSACESITPADCSDGDGCTPDECDLTEGCVELAAHADATPCSAADPCASAATCVTGVCTAGAALDCDDDDPCTDDACDGFGGCLHTFNVAPCDDLDACTSDDVCDGAGACGGTAVVCEDTGEGGCVGSVCVPNELSPGYTCQPGENLDPGVPCDDDDPCTEGETCDGAGNCGGGSGAVGPCDDGDSCTTGDTCDLAGQCVPTATSTLRVEPSVGQRVRAVTAYPSGGFVAIGDEDPENSFVTRFDAVGNEGWSMAIGGGPLRAVSSSTNRTWAVGDRRVAWADEVDLATASQFVNSVDGDLYDVEALSDGAALVVGEHEIRRYGVVADNLTLVNQSALMGAVDATPESAIAPLDGGGFLVVGLGGATDASVGLAIVNADADVLDSQVRVVDGMVAPLAFYDVGREGEPRLAIATDGGADGTWIVAIDTSDLSVVWARRIPALDPAHGMGIVQRAGDGALVAGTDPTTGHGTLLRVSDAAQLHWRRTIDDHAFHATADAHDARFYLAASTPVLFSDALTLSGHSSDGNFGNAVAWDGRYAVIGAPFETADGAPLSSGRVWVHEYDDTTGTWAEPIALVPEGAAPAAIAGWSLAAEGDVVLAGGNTGAFAFATSGAGGAWVQEDFLPAPEAETVYAVALSEPHAAIGIPSASYDFGSGSEDAAGVVVMYTRSGTTWSEGVTLAASDGHGVAHFGLSLAMTVGRLAVGAPDDDNRGAVYIFADEAGGWVEKVKLQPPTQDFELFGYSVALDQAILAVGAPEAQRVYLFEDTQGDGSTWTPIGTLESADNWFGFSVDIDDGLVIVGAPYEDGNFSDGGTVQVFERVALDQWVLRARHLPATAADQHWGWDVAIHQAGILIGGPGVASGFGAAEVSFPGDRAVVYKVDPWGHTECTPGSVCDALAASTCDDGQPCTIDDCDPADGCITPHAAHPNAMPCDDLSPCAVGDTCSLGVCQPGPLPGCDDGDPCTLDSCDDDPTVCAHVTIGCDDGNPCTTDACTSGTGVCTSTPTIDGGGCDDGDPCTSGDHCEAGACVATDAATFKFEPVRSGGAEVVVALPDGYLVGGYLRRPGDLSELQPWLQRLGPGGAPSWSTHFGIADFNPIIRVAPDGARHWVATTNAVGWVLESSDGSGGYVISDEQAPTSLTGRNLIYGISPIEGSDDVIVIARPTTGSTVTAARLGPGLGTPVWGWIDLGATAVSQAHDVAYYPGHGHVVVGAGPNNQAAIWAVSDAGVKLREDYFTTTVSQLRLWQLDRTRSEPWAALARNNLQVPYHVTFGATLDPPPEVSAGLPGHGLQSSAGGGQNLLVYPGAPDDDAITTWQGYAVLDGSGNLRWQRTFDYEPRPIFPQFRSIASAPDGGAVLALEGDSYFAAPETARGRVGEDFGAAVATDNRMVVVGAPGRTGENGEIAAGGIEIYEYDTGTEAFPHHASVAADTPIPDDRFGQSLSCASQSIIAVGAASGAYVFDIQGDMSTWVQSAHFTPEGASGQVLLQRESLHRVIVGAEHADFDSGAVHLYTRAFGAATTWIPEAVLRPSDGHPGQRFGNALAGWPDAYVFVAAAADSYLGHDQGAVYVFAFVEGQWIETQKLVAPDGMPGDRFGAAIDSDSGDLGIAAPGAGKVYLFHRDTSGQWFHLATVEEPVGATPGSLAMDFDNIIIGVPGGGDPPGAGGAEAYWGDDFEPLWVESYVARVPGMAFGSAIDHVGGTVVVGAPGGGAVPGQVTVSTNWDAAAVVRTDPFGRTRCVADSLCAGLGPDGCDDGDPCTSDDCDPALGCVHAPHADGIQCPGNGDCDRAGVCDDALCITAACDDLEVCTLDVCDPDTGSCTHPASAASCDDGDPCTFGDVCAGGACQPGAAGDCDDGDACTIDACDEIDGCSNTPVTCDAGPACATGACDPSTGACVYTFDHGACDDGVGCTLDRCTIDGCTAIADHASCDDRFDCTTDICDADNGCLYDTGGEPCCQGSEVQTAICAAGACTVDQVVEDCADSDLVCSDGACVACAVDADCPGATTCVTGSGCEVPRCVAGACEMVALTGPDGCVFDAVDLDANTGGIVAAGEGTTPLSPLLTFCVTVEGTWSLWSDGAYDDLCAGAPESSPVQPSAGHPNGRVGLDARYAFALLAGSAECGESLPHAHGRLVYRLDGGSDNAGWLEPPWLGTYDAEHRYRFEITAAADAPARFRLGKLDAEPGEPYGVLAVSVAVGACDAPATTEPCPVLADDSLPTHAISATEQIVLNSSNTTLSDLTLDVVRSGAPMLHMAKLGGVQGSGFPGATGLFQLWPWPSQVWFQGGAVFINNGFDRRDVTLLHLGPAALPGATQLRVRMLRSSGNTLTVSAVNDTRNHLAIELDGALGPLPSWSAGATDPIETADEVWAAVPGLSIEVTGSGQPMWIGAVVSGLDMKDAFPSEMRLRLMVDDQERARTVHGFHRAGRRDASLYWIETLSAAAHVIHLEWARSVSGEIPGTGTTTASAATTNRRLVAFELARAADAMPHWQAVSDNGVVIAASDWTTVRGSRLDIDATGAPVWVMFKAGGVAIEDYAPATAQFRLLIDGVERAFTTHQFTNGSHEARDVTLTWLGPLAPGPHVVEVQAKRDNGALWFSRWRDARVVQAIELAR